jgi:hypothetical protein
MPGYGKENKEYHENHAFKTAQYRNQESILPYAFSSKKRDKFVFKFFAKVIKMTWKF